MVDRVDLRDTTNGIRRAIEALTPGRAVSPGRAAGIMDHLNMAQLSKTGVSKVDVLKFRPVAALFLQIAHLRNTSVSIFIRSHSSTEQISC
jgi:hypothetical protein